MKKILINTEFITLVQLLKFEGFIASGGDFLPFMQNSDVLIGGEKPHAKRQKIYPDTELIINGEKLIIKKEG